MQNSLNARILSDVLFKQFHNRITENQDQLGLLSLEGENDLFLSVLINIITDIYSFVLSLYLQVHLLHNWTTSQHLA